MSRKKFAELLKLLLAIAFGYALKVLQSNCSCLNCNTNPVIDCTKCTTCFEKLIDRVTSSPCQTILPANDSNEIQLKEPFKPQSMYEVLRYDYFNKTHIFNNFDDDPRIWLQHHQSADIKDIIGQSVLLYSKAFQHTWRFNKLLNGYRRFDPLRGEEYIIDLELVSEAQDSPWYKAKELVYRSLRFEIVKPFMKAKLLSYRHFLSDTTIYFILPLTHVNERFNTFIQNLIDVAWSKDDAKDDANICLIIVFFLESKDSSAKKNVAILRKAMYDIQQKYVKANIRIIETQQEFSRGIGLHIAAQQLHNDSLLFFCDVDVVFTKEFINRCRLNSVLGKQVYYPMIFAQYNPALIYKYAPPETNNVMDMNKYTGYPTFFVDLCVSGLLPCLPTMVRPLGWLL